MKISALAHASVNQLALINLRIDPCSVSAHHKYVMQPVSIDRFVYITKGSAVFSFGNEQLNAGTKDMVYLPCETAYRSQWQEDSEFMVVDLLIHDASGQPIRFDDKAGVLFCDTHGTYRGLLEELAKKTTTVSLLNGWNDYHSLSDCSMKWQGIQTVLSLMSIAVKSRLDSPISNIISLLNFP